MQLSEAMILAVMNAILEFGEKAGVRGAGCGVPGSMENTG